jgi:hypothetical protein
MVHAAYQMMEVGIRSLPVITPVPVLSSPRSHMAKKVAPALTISLPGPITLLLSAVSSLFIMISWSSFFQMIHTWVLIAIANYPRQTTIVNSTNNHTFAMRSDSGFIVWTQKRYQQHSLFSTPMRWSGVGFLGVGISYVSALDFCRYTASA